MSDDYLWLLLLGQTLTLIGLGIAVWGVDLLSRELFPNAPLPHRRLARWARRVLPWGKTAVVIGAGSLSLSTSSGSARIQTTKARPADDAPATEWHKYWDSRLDNLSERIDWSSQDLKKTQTELGERIQRETMERTEADQKLEQQVKRWIGGDQGRGLMLTFLGLGLTFVGTVGQITADILGS